MAKRVMSANQRKAMWAKRKYYIGYKVRGTGLTAVHNLSKREADEWIARKERGSVYVYKRQHTRKK